MDHDDPRHGTVNGYTNLKCRCPRCRDAQTAAHRRYMEAHPEQQERKRQRDRLYNDPTGEKKARQLAKREAAAKKRAEAAARKARSEELHALIKGLREAGMPYYAIADLLNERGVATARSGRWDKGTIYHIINGN